MRHTRLIRAEPLLDYMGCLHVVLPALEGRVQTRQEVIKMCGDDAHSLLQSGRVAGEHQREGDHAPRQVFDRYLNNYERDLFAAVVLCVGVCESQDEG